jgi:hypothetical protein
MRLSFNRLLAALPDATTAAVYLTAWVAPSIVGAEAVRNLMLTMLIEFVVMHSGAFYGGISSVAKIGRATRVLMLTGLTAFYMMFVFAFSLAFDSTWPIFAFLWLFLCRFFHVWMHPSQSSEETARTTGLWAASVATYIFGAFATVMLPLPALGITPEFIASMHLSGGGEWIERPYTVIAFGLIYFSVQGFAKYLATPATTAHAAADASTT